MFSEAVLDRVVNPRYEGPLTDATHYGVAGAPGDGPYLELWLNVDGGAIRSAAYRTYPCPAAIACGSMVAQLATGRTLETILMLTEDDIDRLVGGLPAGRGHVPRMVLRALRAAAAGGQPPEGDKGD